MDSNSVNSLVGTIWEDQIFERIFLITNQLDDDMFGNVQYEVLYSDYDTGNWLHDDLFEQHKIVRIT